MADELQWKEEITAGSDVRPRVDGYFLRLLTRDDSLVISVDTGPEVAVELVFTRDQAEEFLSRLISACGRCRIG